MKSRFTWIGVKQSMGDVYLYMVIRPTGTSGTITGDSLMRSHSVKVKNGVVTEWQDLGRIGMFGFKEEKENIDLYGAGFFQTNVMYVDELYEGLAREILDHADRDMIFQILKK